MKTSNFAKSGGSPNAIAISRGVPSFYKGERALLLAPTDELWAMDNYSEEDYYEAILKNLDPMDIYDKFKGRILLCWESADKADAECHRRMIARWIERELKIKVPEVGMKIKAQQEDLFPKEKPFRLPYV